PPTPAPPPADTMICQFVEHPKIKVPGENITWYTHANGHIGNTLQPPVVTFEPGTYSLFITQTIGKCESEKSPVNIDVKYTPHEELANKAVMCENDLKLIGKNADGVTYKWNTGSISCCVMPEREGLYQRAATNECGSYIDSIWVYHQSCDDCIVFPNAFTPVSGSANNIFRALLKCPVDEFSIRIYNRWGNIVYQAEDVNEGWNGRTNYEWAPQGVYIYIVEYRAKGKVQKQQIAGNVMLMR
ncbi:MAG TPA: gliding motility-associated C-terminal domain-containing protein, partial [Flavipsychrobacter sp.]